MLRGTDRGFLKRAGVVAAVVVAAASAHAQFYEFTFPGASSRDGWQSMNSVTFPGYGGFPGASGWTNSPAANLPGSGDAVLTRLAGGADRGGPFFAIDSLYFGSWVQLTNRLGGTLRVSDPTPVAGVRTVIFQIQIGEATGYDFHLPNGRPVLKVNGATNGTAPVAAVVLNRYQNGTYPSPETLQDEPVYVNTWGFEWSVPAAPAVTNIAIDFSAVAHGQIYQIRLDQSATVASGVFLPELAMETKGTPTFDGTNTSVTHTFLATPGALLQVDYREDLGSGSWLSAGLQNVDNAGNLSVNFSRPDDHLASWSRRMFFRVYHPSNP